MAAISRDQQKDLIREVLREQAMRACRVSHTRAQWRLSPLAASGACGTRALHLRKSAHARVVADADGCPFVVGPVMGAARTPVTEGQTKASDRKAGGVGLERRVRH